MESKMDTLFTYPGMPEDASPVISEFMEALNDNWTDAERASMLRTRLAGTRRTSDVEVRRSLMAADWLVRTCTPAYLRLAGLTAQADMLAEIPEITDLAQVPSIRRIIWSVRTDAVAACDAAQDAAREAEWPISRDAPWDETWESAWDAAWDAAWDPSGDAACNAAGVAAGASAWDDAWYVAHVAARVAIRGLSISLPRDDSCAKLRQFKEHVQSSAIELIERMIAAN